MVTAAGTLLVTQGRFHRPATEAIVAMVSAAGRPSKSAAMPTATPDVGIGGSWSPPTSRSDAERD